MAGVRVIVLYPSTADVETFERKYDEHLSWAPKKISGLTQLMAGRVLGTPGGDAAPFPSNRRTVLSVHGSSSGIAAMCRHAGGRCRCRRTIERRGADLPYRRGRAVRALLTQTP